MESQRGRLVLPGKKNSEPLYKSLASITSENEIRRYIDLDGKPNRVSPIEKIERALPKSFEKIDNPPIYENKFPFGEIGIASLHVASRRGIDLLKGIDFCFGGSVLDVLASKGEGKRGRYIVCRVPNTQCVFVSNKSSYKKDPSNIGFQFERLVTGGGMADVSNIQTAEHIHTMKVGEKTILFRAEVDAMDENDAPVEIKVTPKTWTTSVMFQMISSGSLTLCKGTNTKVSAPKIPRRGRLGGGGKSKSHSVLTSVEFLGLAEVASLAFQYADVRDLERNILDALDAIQSQLVGDDIYKLCFPDDGTLTLEKLDSSDANEFNPFPPDNVVQRLIE